MTTVLFTTEAVYADCKFTVDGNSAGNTSCKLNLIPELPLGKCVVGETAKELKLVAMTASGSSHLFDTAQFFLTQHHSLAPKGKYFENALRATLIYQREAAKDGRLMYIAKDSSGALYSLVFDPLMAKIEGWSTELRSIGSGSAHHSPESPLTPEDEFCLMAMMDPSSGTDYYKFADGELTLHKLNKTKMRKSAFVNELIARTK